eukprot:11513702-Prorocentrum_lima.AAC.1
MICPSRGLAQGCVLSPTLFAGIMDGILSSLLPSWQARRLILVWTEKTTPWMGAVDLEVCPMAYVDDVVFLAHGSSRRCD